MYAKEKIAALLAEADITVNGPEAWDIQVRDERLYRRILAGGTLALGEAYMDGWWDALSLDAFIDRALRANLKNRLVTPSLLFHIFRARLLNLQNATRAFTVGIEHYDIGNDLYAAMLDKRMVYTCGYWNEANNLDEAQEKKLDLVCKKIGLKKGDRVLDIGGGWASFGIYAAEKYGAEVVAVTVSKAQQKLGEARAEGFPVEIRMQDYRDVSDGPYDHIVSLGMLEHVGYKNYRTYMKVVHRLLKEDGLFLLHTIGSNRSVYATDPWIEKYIFSGGMLPSVKQIGGAVEDLFVMEDWHNFGADYDKTLMAWFERFDYAWPKLKTQYSERFYRMWKYYLLSCAGMFRSRQTAQLWQMVLSKRGVRGGYHSIR